MVLNYTDVDDKIINKSNDTGLTVQEITSRYIESYEKMLSQLKVMKPTVQPRATEHIKEMLDLIKKMEEKGYTYVANGSVYFDTSKIKFGVFEGKLIDDKMIIQLASLPPKEALLGKLVGLLKSPLNNLVYNLNYNTSKLVFVLKAIEEKKA